MAKRKPQATFRLKINAHELRGEKWPHGWLFACDSWPELAREHEGAADTEAIHAEFTRRAVAGGGLLVVESETTKPREEPKP